MEAAPLHCDPAEVPPGGRAFWLRTADGVRLRAAHWARDGGARGTVLILPGRTECIEKYGPTVADMAAGGYDVVVLDNRGQGLADRPLADRMVGHIRDFADYQRDLAALLPILDTLPKPLFLLGHSMGGAIGFRALAQGLPVLRAAFLAPMWGIRFSPGLGVIAVALARVSGVLGRGTTYAPTTGPVPYVMAAPFADNTLTGHEPTWDWMRAQLAAHPALQLGGPSMDWLAAAVAETRWIARQPPPQVATLTLLGTAERIVETRAVEARMRGWPGGRLVLLPGAQHETLMETPAIRAEAIGAILAHFAA